MIRVHQLILLAAVAVGLVMPNTVLGQAWKGQVGFDRLVAEYGGTAPANGAGVRVAMPEALVGGEYFPNAASSEFDGKTIFDATGNTDPGNFSTHATGVANTFFGNTLSIAPGITDITSYDANEFINNVIGAATGADPSSDSFDITNHSYVGQSNDPNAKLAVLSRIDFLVNRDNTVTVVGTNNTATNTTPAFLSTSFNAIVVGVTDGDHARGATTQYGPGRLKPDIVGPAGFTSTATPMVSGAAAILKSAGMGTSAGENEAIKAMLFAGATKSEFPSWDRTTTRPVDDEFGFGELNIYNSYKMLEGGEFDGSTTEPTSSVGEFGYDFENFNGVDDLFYDIDILEGRSLSAALVWNAIVTDNNPSTAVFDPTVSVANLDLLLYDSSGSFMGTLLDSSVSTDYNYEHIYLRGLSAGRYTLRITGGSAVDFGLAWSAVPEPSGTLICGMLLLGALARRRR